MSRIRISLLLLALLTSFIGESLSVSWAKSFDLTSMANAYQKRIPQKRSSSAPVNQEIDIDEWGEASMFCKVDQVKELLAKGASVNADLGSGRTPLMNAAGGGCVEVAQLLIQKGAKVNAKDSDDKTAFIHAAQGGQSQIIAVLIAPMSAKPNPTDTLLMHAALIGNAENVQSLLSKGNDPNAKGTYGATPLIYAAITGHSKVIQMLLDKRADINLGDKTGLTALMYAARGGRTEIITLLLSKGADINGSDKGGMTVLMNGVMSKRADIVQLLLNKGANVSAQGSGITALQMAKQNGYDEIVALLKKAGAKE